MGRHPLHPAAVLRRGRRAVSSLRARLRRQPAAPTTPPTTAPPTTDPLGDITALLTRSEVRAAQALADEELDRPRPTTEALLAAGLVAHRRRLYPRALDLFDRAGEPAALSRTPLAYVESLFRADPQRGLASTRRWLVEAHAEIRAQTWHQVLAQVFAHGDDELRHRVHDRLVESHDADDGGWAAGGAEVDWLERWRHGERSSTAPNPEGRVPYAVMDYVQPGRGKTSQNIGDQVQTLASLGHVARHQNLRFHGEPGLVGVLEELQASVRPELRLTDTVRADVELYQVDRDASTFQAFPEDTWLLEFGWHSHDLAGAGVWDFPLHPNLRPVFVSFHCSKRGLLTPEALEHLRTYGPVGCRDWTTVDLLLSLDVPAFFSGCLTTTVSTVFPELDARAPDATVYVDAVRDPVPDGNANRKQSYPAVKYRSLAENLRQARSMLESYRTGYTHVVTKRLHCYLPTRSLGLDVDFRPSSYADVRFAGLHPLDDHAFESMRTGMLSRLEPVLGAVFAGRPVDEVYALWRETVAPEVDAARARHRSRHPLPVLPVDPATLAAPAAVGADDVTEAVADRAVDVVLAPRREELVHVGPALRALDAAATGAQRVWVVGPRARSVTLPRLSGRTRVTLVPTGGMDTTVDDITARQRPHLALLPHLLPDVDRAVVLPVAAVVLGDVAELADVDLGGHAVAARRATHFATSGFGVLYHAARRLDDAPERAFDLYRRMHARHVFDFDGFDTGVMVLDLARLRADGFATDALTLMREFRLDAREALHLYVGPHRAELDPAWNHVPTRDVPSSAPKLVHWADATKPWDHLYVARQDLWFERTGRSTRPAEPAARPGPPPEPVRSAPGAAGSASPG